MQLLLSIEEAKKMLDQLQHIDYYEDQACSTAHSINDYILDIFSGYDLHDNWDWNDKEAEILLYHEHRVIKKNDELYAVRQSDSKFIILKGEDKEYVQSLIDEYESYLSITVEL
jgi:hypothetical protein